MIRHIVMFSAKDSNDVNTIRDALAKLSDIPESQYFEVKTNLSKDAISSEIDVVVYGEFESEASLEAYKNHPIYAETIKTVRPLRDKRIVADIKSSQ